MKAMEVIENIKGILLDINPITPLQHKKVGPCKTKNKIKKHYEKNRHRRILQSENKDT